MSFKPASNSGNGNSDGPSIDYNAINTQVKGGSRPARVSLIVDLGKQEREDFTEDYAEKSSKHIKAMGNGTGRIENEDGKDVIYITQKPVDQIAVFADLTSDVVDYGENLGKQPYRIVLNKSYQGKLHGIPFNGCYSFDKNGQILKDKGFTFHNTSVLTKLAKATKQDQIVSGSGDDNMDISQLLGKPFMATVDKQVRNDNTYINYKGCSEVPLVPSDPTDPDSDEVPLGVKKLKLEPMCITFDDVTEENAKFIRGDIRKAIKLALNYEGSKMQEVLEASSNSKPEKPKHEEPEEQYEEPSDGVGDDRDDDSLPY